MIAKLFKKIGRNKKGFTLIELLVVIAILGILAAILIPLVGGYITSANSRAANSDARSVYTAAASVVAQNPDITFSTYSDTDLAAGGTRAAGTMYKSDITPFLGSNTFTSVTITFDSGSPTQVDITESNGTTGTYSRT